MGGVRAGPAGPARGELDADDPGTARHERRPGRHVRGAARARRARAPPLRLLRHLGRGLRRTGGTRPRRHRDQADPVPDLGGQPDRRVPHPGVRARQAGGDGGRAPCPLRRAGQHRMGQGAGGGRGPRGLWPRRAEDPLEDLPRAPPRGGRDPRYCHIGSGNYNSKTARIYEDIGLFTADEDIGSDLGDLFNHLTGFSRTPTTARSWSPRSRPGTGSSR